VWIETGAELRARFPAMVGVWEGSGARAIATVPIALAGETVGAMSFTFRDDRALPPEERDFFLALGRQAALALDRARLLDAAQSARDAAEREPARGAAANRAKSDFLAAMSHELRTPLNAIQGHVQLIEMGLHGPVTEAQAGTLARVQRSQQYLLSLINDVLNFARIEAGRVEYDVRPTDLVEVMAVVRPLVEPQMAAKGLHFDVRLPPGPCLVRADHDKLVQVLVNLLSNATKFTDALHPATGAPGRVRVDVATRPDAPSDLLFLRVIDTGRGIPRDRQEAIFDPFVQLRGRLTHGQAPHADGIGLGLAISRDLARGMGGDLRVRSEEGEGSTFTLTLLRA
jgi:signal transduction histidine kinase